MNAAQLKGDLKHIESAVDRADAPQAVKRILGDLIEWNRGLVDQSDKRIAELEGAVDGLLEGVDEEGLSVETAKVFLAAFEQSRHVCAAVAALLESDQNPLDDVTSKNFSLLIRGCAKSVETANEVLQAIVFEEEETEEDEEAEIDEGDEEAEGDEETEEGTRG